MRLFFTIALTLFLSSTVWGSARYQIPDKIVYNGKIYDLENRLLESYFKQYPEKRPEVKRRTHYLRRGYVATFEIKDNQLYLKDIEILINNPRLICSDTIWESVLNEVFPNQESVKMDWITGSLGTSCWFWRRCVTADDRCEYNRNGILLKIKEGKLKKTKKVSRKKMKKIKE